MNLGAKHYKSFNRSISTIWKRIFTSVEENTQFIFYLISPLPNHSPSRNIPTLIGLDSAMAKKQTWQILREFSNLCENKKESKATDNVVWDFELKPKINNWYYVNDNLTWGYLSLHRKNTISCLKKERVSFRKKFRWAKSCSNSCFKRMIFTDENINDASLLVDISNHSFYSIHKFFLECGIAYKVNLGRSVNMFTCKWEGLSKRQRCNIQGKRFKNPMLLYAINITNWIFIHIYAMQCIRGHT